MKPSVNLSRLPTLLMLLALASIGAAFGQDNSEPGEPAEPSSPAETRAPSSGSASPGEQSASYSLGDINQLQSIVIDRGLTALGKSCVDCHLGDKMPAAVQFPGGALGERRLPNPQLIAAKGKVFASPQQQGGLCRESAALIPDLGQPVADPSDLTWQCGTGQHQLFSTTKPQTRSGIRRAALSAMGPPQSEKISTMPSSAK
ncbi:hypothetical protein Thiosp_03186 [Thiorhodovibrio litoralis]|nr:MULTISPECIES: hypothetical protein [Thiorhodovibrio]WPL13385.1 hypothetical protein Thiosp_03186 [Thiorhodovibrio litoralis]